MKRTYQYRVSFDAIAVTHLYSQPLSDGRLPLLGSTTSDSTSAARTVVECVLKLELRAKKREATGPAGDRHESPEERSIVIIAHDDVSVGVGGVELAVRAERDLQRIALVRGKAGAAEARARIGHVRRAARRAME